MHVGSPEAAALCALKILRAVPMKLVQGRKCAGETMESHDTVTEDLIAERRLWTAVVVSAVEEWKTGSLRARREAQQFLFENKDDFELVCAGAGLDPNDMRSRLKKVGRMITGEGALAS
jgi:hypothetical protein